MKIPKYSRADVVNFNHDKPQTENISLTVGKAHYKQHIKSFFLVVLLNIINLNFFLLIEKPKNPFFYYCFG